ncbi:hypothetical protein ACRAWF_20760 [Streptomyces sp. L7]
MEGRRRGAGEHRRDQQGLREEAHPKIKIDFKYTTADPTYTQKLQPELLGGKAGDVI